MHQDAKEILYTAEQLQARVAELGRLPMTWRSIMPTS